ncbi:4Fe-4S dicluster domain-containing protein [Desulfotalea psychrophila]|uniref:Related to hydrogenase n=1 Tax=Desulfotalea psychrophila (strain LSv54 / DSM 12343) TaxID=177439 RepID=Q6AKL7_DESPS|nr:4Fe-4S dicluster domain-containing protein [Desulfotalea psychrophila]CAG37108.1 related to hydrogenase [Desulfotalea psychrophila LSv54]
MYFKSYHSTINHEVLNLITKAFFSDDFAGNVNAIPIQMRPRDQKASSRCCIWRERAIIRYRCMAFLGFAIEQDDDELKSLAEYAEMALKRDSVTSTTLTFIDEACNACVRTHYEVTNACQGCLAQACIQSCPKDAITMVQGKSHIDSNLCINCGKCLKVCPYHAIVQIPIPCEVACPIGAISKDVSGRQVIDYDLCIFCGKCMAQCPFAAVLEKSQMLDVLKAMRSGEKLVAMVAPAIAGEFDASMAKLVTALKKIGFAQAAEVSSGADITAHKEAEEFVERMEEGAPFMTTSCCPAYTMLVRKHLTDLGEFVSDTRTPMHYTAAKVKAVDSNYKTVFIGPCVAKRKEGARDEGVDYVLTFQELGSLFAALEIDFEQCEDGEYMFPAMREGRSFPVTGGVTAGITAMIGDRTEVKPISINGLDKMSMRELKRYSQKREAPGNFIEVMGCEGGCVAGPANLISLKKATKKCQDFAKNSPSILDK